jgi:hypothetical protein
MLMQSLRLFRSEECKEGYDGLTFDPTFLMNSEKLIDTLSKSF